MRPPLGVQAGPFSDRRTPLLRVKPFASLNGLQELGPRPALDFRYGRDPLNNVRPEKFETRTGAEEKPMSAGACT